METVMGQRRWTRIKALQEEGEEAKERCRRYSFEGASLVLGRTSLSTPFLFGIVLKRLF